MTFLGTPSVLGLHTSVGWVTATTRISSKITNTKTPAASNMTSLRAYI